MVTLPHTCRGVVLRAGDSTACKNYRYLLLPHTFRVVVCSATAVAAALAPVAGPAAAAAAAAVTAVEEDSSSR